MLIDLCKQVDTEMEKTRREEGEASDVVSAHGDLTILNAAATINARQNRYQLDVLAAQGLSTSELDRLQDALDCSAPIWRAPPQHKVPKKNFRIPPTHGSTQSIPRSRSKRAARRQSSTRSRRCGRPRHQTPRQRRPVPVPSRRPARRRSRHAPGRARNMESGPRPRRRR